MAQGALQMLKIKKKYDLILFKISHYTEGNDFFLRSSAENGKLLNDNFLKV